MLFSLRTIFFFMVNTHPPALTFCKYEETAELQNLKILNDCTTLTSLAFVYPCYAVTLYRGFCVGSTGPVVFIQCYVIALDTC